MSSASLDALVARDVHVHAGSFPAVRGVSATFQPGVFSAVIGPNGAGKSTLLRALLGLNPVTQGEVTLAGRPLGEWSRAQRSRQLAYLAQSEGLPDGAVPASAGERPRDITRAMTAGGCVQPGRMAPGRFAKRRRRG